MQRSLPSIEIRGPASFSRSFQAKDVNWLPLRRMAARPSQFSQN